MVKNAADYFFKNALYTCFSLDSIANAKRENHFLSKRLIRLGRNTLKKSILYVALGKCWQKLILQMTKKIVSSDQERHRSLQSVLMLEIVLLYTWSKLVAKE